MHVDHMIKPRVPLYMGEIRNVTVKRGDKCSIIPTEKAPETAAKRRTFPFILLTERVEQVRGVGNPGLRWRGPSKAVLRRVNYSAEVGTDRLSARCAHVKMNSPSSRSSSCELTGSPHHITGANHSVTDAFKDTDY